MTKAQFIRDIANGNMSAEMVYRFGEEIPERLKGVRPLLRSNSVAVFFRNADGRESELRLPKANLFEYDGERLKIYRGGERELTEKERSAMNEWKEIDKTIPIYENSYWRHKKFFIDRDMEYLLGYGTVKGKRLVWRNNSPMVYDEAIRGELEMEYVLIKG